jgi:hypothetical protein
MIRVHLWLISWKMIPRPMMKSWAEAKSSKSGQMTDD